MTGHSTAAKWPRDPALPQLAHALSPQCMAQTFAAVLGGRTVLACAIDRVKYRPGRNCTVSYVLSLGPGLSSTLPPTLPLGQPPALHPRGDASGRVEQRVAARFCSQGDAARRYRAACARSPVPSRAGPSLTHLPELDMLAHWLPNDAKLNALAHLLDADLLAGAGLADVVQTLTGGRGRLLDQHTTLVQYVPESRACARVELAVQREPGAMTAFDAVYVKATAERDGAQTHAAATQLWNSPARGRGAFSIPEPLCWQPAPGLLWLRAAPGRPLPEVDPLVGVARSAQVGAELAALHGTPVAGLPGFEAGALQSRLHAVAALLGTVEPAWVPTLARLVARLDRGIEPLVREPLATLHGDLHPNNLLADGPTLTFIDLDDLHRAPAVLELGAWVADALYRAVDRGTELEAAAPAWRAFLAAHAEASGRHADPHLLAWSVACHLLCQRAYRGVANLKPGRFEAVPTLLALAASIAETGSVDAALCPEACDA